ncbi:hypothetical protein QCA50_010496 [Cerrena zonata]|uniref:Uncharacterized protein n=1 Tax=Cerrena zonata TaxID=2478898 RepID=A0AAW0G1L1_9APHY
MTFLAPNVWNGYESDKKCLVEAEFFDAPLEPCKWGKCMTLLDPNDRDATWRHMSAHIQASFSKILAAPT